jgi:hypothetical protein
MWLPMLRSDLPLPSSEHIYRRKTSKFVYLWLAISLKNVCIRLLVYWTTLLSSKGLGRKRSRLNFEVLSHLPGGLRKTTKTLSQDSLFPGRIWTRDLQNTKQDCWTLGHDIRFLCNKDITDVQKCETAMRAFQNKNALPLQPTYAACSHISIRIVPIDAYLSQYIALIFSPFSVSQFQKCQEFAGVCSYKIQYQTCIQFFTKYKN